MADSNEVVTDPRLEKRTRRRFSVAEKMRPWGQDHGVRSFFLHVKSDQRRCPAEPGISGLSYSRFFHRQHQALAHEPYTHRGLHVEPGGGERG